MKKQVVKVEATLKHPVMPYHLIEFLKTLPVDTSVYVSSFDGDVTIRWEEKR